MSRLTEALKEPSTHAGVGVMLQAASIAFPQYALILAGLGSIFGFGAMVMPERAAPPVQSGTVQAPSQP